MWNFAFEPQHPTKKEAEFQYLLLWAHNELTKLGHHYQECLVLIRHGSRTLQEQCLKCINHEGGTVYFLFTASAYVEEGDMIVWGTSQVVLPEEWHVERRIQFSEYVRCDVRRPAAGDVQLGEILGKAGLTQAASYLANAEQRFSEGTPAARSDCVAGCRNALQDVTRQLTGEGQLGQGLRKLKNSIALGGHETEFVEALDKLLLALRDVLSKSGAHPPMPDEAITLFALEVTKATLRFVLTARCAQSAG